jgi:Glycosyl transferase family 2
VSNLSKLNQSQAWAMGSFIRNAFGKFARSEFIEFTVRGRVLPFKVRHLYGPRSIDYADDELVAVCVVRNGSLHIDAFFQHHEALGIKHFVFLDNQSSDSTVEMLCSRKNVTVLQTGATYAKFENAMKRFLVNSYCKGRWSLCVDIDEHFDFPYSHSLSLKDFLRYLNEHRYTGVINQMLDMFSDLPLSDLGRTTQCALKRRYNRYDISAIEKVPYRHQPIENGRIKKHFGGVRKTIFGTNNGLTKVSLIRIDGQLEPFVQWHHTRGARIADISCVLLHYPFIDFAAKASEAIRSQRYGMFTATEYVYYAKAMEENPDLSMNTKESQIFTDLDDLIANDFLVVTDTYRQWASDHAALGCPPVRLPDQAVLSNRLTIY